MPRPRPPHLHLETTRHGKPVWYVRVGKGPRIRLRAEFGSPEFGAEYQAAIGGTNPPVTAKPDSKSLAWLWERYRETGEWLNEYSASTRRMRENIMKHVLDKAGSKPYAVITSRHII